MISQLCSVMQLSAHRRGEKFGKYDIILVSVGGNLNDLLGPIWQSVAICNHEKSLRSQSGLKQNTIPSAGS